MDLELGLASAESSGGSGLAHWVPQAPLLFHRWTFANESSTSPASWAAFRRTPGADRLWPVEPGLDRLALVLLKRTRKKIPLKGPEERPKIKNHLKQNQVALARAPWRSTQPHDSPLWGGCVWVLVIAPAPATRQGGWQAFGLWPHRRRSALESLKGNFSRTSGYVFFYVFFVLIMFLAVVKFWGRSHHSVVGLFESSCGATLSYIHVCSRSVVILWRKFKLKHAQVTLKVKLACICHFERK